MPLEWVDEGDAAWERLRARLDGPRGDAVDQLSVSGLRWSSYDS